MELVSFVMENESVLLRKYTHEGLVSFKGERLFNSVQRAIHNDISIIIYPYDLSF